MIEPLKRRNKMNDEQIKILVDAINNLTEAIKDIGKKISSSDDTLTEAVSGITDAIELK
jgi:flagellar hook-associated protein FlgK